MNAILRWLGRVDYAPTWRAMQSFTDARDADTPDEVWFLEHAPVFTQGLNGRPEHLLATGDIPVVGIDRGGQATYHGPGQLVVYTLIDLRRRGIGVRELVVALENAVVALAARHGIAAASRPASTSATGSSRAWACGSGAAAATTGSRSTWTWISSRSDASIPAGWPGSR